MTMKKETLKIIVKNVKHVFTPTEIAELHVRFGGSYDSPDLELKPCCYFFDSGDMCGEPATHLADFGEVSGKMPLCRNHAGVYRAKARCEVDEIKRTA